MSLQGQFSPDPIFVEDRFEHLSEAARQVVQHAYVCSMDKLDAQSKEDIQAITTGLLMGTIGALLDQGDGTDAHHAKVRERITLCIPEAVDILRSISNLPPLPSA